MNIYLYSKDKINYKNSYLEKKYWKKVIFNNVQNIDYNINYDFVVFNLKELKDLDNSNINNKLKYDKWYCFYQENEKVNNLSLEYKKKFNKLKFINKHWYFLSSYFLYSIFWNKKFYNKELYDIVIFWSSRWRDFDVINHINNLSYKEGILNSIYNLPSILIVTSEEHYIELLKKYGNISNIDILYNKNDYITFYKLLSLWKIILFPLLNNWNYGDGSTVFTFARFVNKVFLASNSKYFSELIIEDLSWFLYNDYKGFIKYLTYLLEHYEEIKTWKYYNNEYKYKVLDQVEYYVTNLFNLDFDYIN